MWAWNTMSSFLPMDWDNDWSSEQQLGYNGHAIHLGIFIDDATVTFKVRKREINYSYLIFFFLNMVILFNIFRQLKV